MWMGDTSGYMTDSDHSSGNNVGDTDDSLTVREMIEQAGEESVFRNRNLVEPDTIIDRDRIVGRDDQLRTVVSNLRKVLNENRPPNLLLYGPAGTGKSLIFDAVARQIRDISKNRGYEFGTLRINCQNLRSLDEAVYALVREAAHDLNEEIGVARHGVSTSTKYDRLYDLLDEGYDSVVFVLDEIDLLLGRRSSSSEPAYSDLIYQLSRASIESIDIQVSVAALTNDPEFMNNLDARAESSFNPRDIPFSDYDANQLQEILRNREDAFIQDALSEDVIPLTSAFAAQSHGDARKAIDLLRKAGDVANENGDLTVTENHVREAQEDVETDRSLKLVEGLTTQKKISLYATAAVAEFGKSGSTTASSRVAFPVYQFLTDVLDADGRTRETFNNYVREVGTYGQLDHERKSLGGKQGGGMYLMYEFKRDPGEIKKRLEQDERIADLSHHEDGLKRVIQAQKRNFAEN